MSRLLSGRSPRYRHVKRNISYVGHCSVRLLTRLIQFTATSPRLTRYELGPGRQRETLPGVAVVDRRFWRISLTPARATFPVRMKDHCLLHPYGRVVVLRGNIRASYVRSSRASLFADPRSHQREPTARSPTARRLVDGGLRRTHHQRVGSTMSDLKIGQARGTFSIGGVTKKRVSG